ncbi:MAG: hemolysin III family protein [Acidimicrobiales bacterium]
MRSWAFFASIPAAMTLVVLARSEDQGRGDLIYGLSLMAVFGVSAAYHRLAHSDAAQRRMQRLDHSTIYVIAGTYTPVCLPGVAAGVSGISALAVVWTCAVAGIVLKLVGPDRWMRWSNGFYPVLGWAALVLTPVLIRSLTGPELWLLVFGGALYTVGALVFLRRRPDPRPQVFGYHEIWHAFTVAAGLSHFAMVTLVTI